MPASSILALTKSPISRFSDVHTTSLLVRVRPLEYPGFFGSGPSMSISWTLPTRELLIAFVISFWTATRFCSLAEVASLYGYTMPSVSDNGPIIIKEGRHPVLERVLPPGSFVPNDLLLDDKQRLLIITGPNMGGKSTYCRQTAIIVLMAQMGSFVPCKSCSISCVDKIFARVGAYDDLVLGQSTFMVEMNEVSRIVKSATPKSLVILDEIGRGTSTFDGLSVAWAVVEYLASDNRAGARCLLYTSRCV